MFLKFNSHGLTKIKHPKKIFRFWQRNEKLIKLHGKSAKNLPQACSVH